MSSLYKCFGQNVSLNISNKDGSKRSRDEKTLKFYNDRIEKLEDMMESQGKEIKKLERRDAEKDVRIKAMEKQLAAKDEIIKELKEENSSLSSLLAEVITELRDRNNSRARGGSARDERPAVIPEGYTYRRTVSTTCPFTQLLY